MLGGLHRVYSRGVDLGSTIAPLQRIIRLLEDGERTVGELVEALGEPQPRVSTHLACLRHCGFVETERRGREIIYRLALTGLEDLLRYAAQVAEPEAERLASCTRIGPDWV